jgi:hypothetical protein
LLVLDLLLELSQLCAVGCCAICLQHLDVSVAGLANATSHGAHVILLVGEGRDLLLFYLIVGEVLLVLLPARARGGGHLGGLDGDDSERSRVMAEGFEMREVRDRCGSVSRGGVASQLMAESGREVAADVVVCHAAVGREGQAASGDPELGAALMVLAIREIVRLETRPPKVRQTPPAPHDTRLLSLFPLYISKWQPRLQTAAVEMLHSRYKERHRSFKAIN